MKSKNYMYLGNFCLYSTVDNCEGSAYGLQTLDQDQVKRSLRSALNTLQQFTML